MKKITLKTNSRSELIDITSKVQQYVTEEKIKSSKLRATNSKNHTTTNI
ncbi:hypothetical protein ACFL56_00840 [Candidatus Margulisiibacteriota bacterium]